MTTEARTGAVSPGRVGRHLASPGTFVAGAAGLAVLALVLLRAGTAVGPTALVLGTALLIALAALRDSGSATILWLAASVLSLGLNQSGALSLDRLAFVALVAVWFGEVISGKRHLARFGGVEAMMFLYVAVQIGSALAPHELAATSSDGRVISLVQLIQTSSIVPFTLYMVARSAFGSAVAVRRFLWFVIGFATYLSLTNIAQFNGLDSLVWPKFILTSTWRNRAPGIFDQPIVSGLVIAIGLAASLFVASQRDERLRWVAAACVLPMGPGIFYTHSRAPLLAAIIVVFGGLIFAGGFRTGFAILAATALLIVAANWSTVTSSDRSKGGVSSSGEIEDRLNSMATAQWAIVRKPVFGWGIGRFGQLNTIHHQQWGHLDWRRGYGITSHETQHGIAAELGLVGLTAWLGLLLAIVVRVGKAWRALPRSGITGRGLGTVFFLAFTAWLASSTTFEIRFFQIMNAFIFIWAGMVVALAERALVERRPLFPADHRPGTLRPR